MKEKAQRSGSPKPASTSREVLFRFSALVFPLVLFLLLEVVLRLVGYGYSPHFFLPLKVNGTNYFIENQKFSRRYFPPALARTPQPVLFPEEKPRGLIRIFVLGESAAMGDPEPAFGLARILEVLLETQFPESRFEVINAAVTAINSHVIREIARDCASANGDLWIIYMGNNEVVGPFGSGTVFGAQVPGHALIRANLALKTTRAGQLFDAVAGRLSKSRYPTAWEGMEMFLKQQVALNDRRMPKVYDHFDRNLSDILSIAKRSGASLILSTVASNLKDSPPFASLHDPKLPGPDRKKWEDAFLAGSEEMSRTNFVAALANYAVCQGIDPQFAELHFRMGQCQLALGRTNEAKTEFELARDLDTLRFRADTHLNASIRAQAAKGGVGFVDAVELFATNSPAGIAGRELLLEHVHMNFKGNYILARALADKAAALLASKLQRQPRTEWLSESDCAARLAFTDWDRLQLTDEMIRRFEDAPFNQQFNHKARHADWERERDLLQKSCRGDKLDPMIATYRRAIDIRPNDWVLRENFAKLLQSTGDPAGAEQQWRSVLALLPHSEQALYSLGNVLDAQGKSAEALPWFQRALQKRPASAEARNGLGVALSNQGQNEQAIEQYREVLRHNPRFAEARINLGQALAELGRDDEAIAEYSLALQADSNNVAAHINLGKLLARKNRPADAEQEYLAALRVNPDDAIAHHNLGNLLTTLGRADATRHFEAAVRANPQLAEARYNLGLAYASANRNAEAIGQFKDVVRLRPKFVQAWLNLGVALAKQHRYAEAITAFNETLKLDPDNPDAKRFLPQAQKLSQ